MSRSQRLGLLLLLGGLAQPAWSSPPTLTFEEEALVVSGLTPGATVLVFSIAREVSENAARVVRRDQTLDDTDLDGSVSFGLSFKLPPRSLWVAVDQASGELAIGAPGTYPVRVAPFPATSFSATLGEGDDRLEDSRYWLEGLVVRPGVGAWTLTAGDGDAADLDGQTDGKLGWSLASAQSTERSPPPPATFAAGDRLVVIDPLEMELYQTVVTSTNRP